MTPLSSCAQALDSVRGLSSHAQAEVFAVVSESRVQEWSEGRPENLAFNRSQGLGLRVLREGRLGFSSTNRDDADSVQWLGDTAIAASQFAPQEPDLELPGPQKLPMESPLDLVDPAIDFNSFPSRAEFLGTLEKEVKRRDSRLTKVLRASYREGRHESSVASSLGVQAATKGTTVSLSLACVAKEGEETQVGYGFQMVRHLSDLKIEWVIDKTVENTLALLGGKPVPSGRYDLLLDPFVAAEMLELIADALRGDQVLKGKSFLAGRLGQKIGSKRLTIVDDGRMKRGLGSAAADAEGMPTQTTPVVQEGVLTHFLYDSTSAKKSHARSTGNAGRASYRVLPEPETTNFYITAGQLSPEALIAGVDSGLFVHNVLGLHTVDTVSGDFSLGIMGERIEKGRRTHGVRGVTIAGNLLDLLDTIEAVGSDLTFSGSMGSPTLWVRQISVGGS